MSNPTTNDTGELRDKFKSIAYALAVNSYNSDQPRLVDHADDTVEQLLDLFTQYSQQREQSNIQDWVNRGLEATNPDVWFRCLQMINDELATQSPKEKTE